MVEAVMTIKVDTRTREAKDMQGILTRHGCIIKTRLGIHDTPMDACSEQGIIILYVIGTEEEVKTLKDDLCNLSGLKVNYMDID